jgi:hypothetical protein
VKAKWEISVGPHSTQPKNKEKMGRKKYEFCLGGYFWHLGVIFGAHFETCCVSH